MPPATRSRGAADATTRLRLIEAAGPVFARRGFADATVREIVAAAGANIAAVNYHFGDKLGLYRAVLEHYAAAAIAAHPVPSGAQTDPRAMLGAFVAAFLERLFHEGKPAWMSQIIAREMVEPTPAFQQLADSHMRPQLEALRAIVSRLMGLPPTDERVHRCAASVIAQCVTYKQCGAAHRILTPGQTYCCEGREQLAAHITAFSLAGIAAHTPPGSKGGRR
ncbi:MAG TPA: CerR family C-terminal domain-containing protein [Phycisphaerales bacterium]|nr:CerR family C-terminal domain-containing protein [Phycisphaerales bacterium]